MNKTISEHAHAAKLIRKELKQTFPSVKLSVSSSSFSGGDSVSIKWEDGPTYNNVTDITCKYQYGLFNSSEDIYEYTNKNNSLPQVKFVQATREIKEETYQEALKICKKRYACFESVNCLDDLIIGNYSVTALEFIRRYIYEIDLQTPLTEEKFKKLDIS